MIRSFADKRTGMAFAGESSKGFPSSLLKVARRKLKMVDAAVVLTDLRVPPEINWKHCPVTARDNIR